MIAIIERFQGISWLHLDSLKIIWWSLTSFYDKSFQREHLFHRDWERNCETFLVPNCWLKQIFKIKFQNKNCWIRKTLHHWLETMWTKILFIELRFNLKIMFSSVFVVWLYLVNSCSSKFYVEVPENGQKKDCGFQWLWRLIGFNNQLRLLWYHCTSEAQN